MADREVKRGDHAPQEEREGFGDDQGTRVGSPDPAEKNPPERTREHKSGYGGDGGDPKVSSDQREKNSPR